jgi:dCMP deaminase
MTNPPENRPSWDEYFLMMAKLAATRSTCLAFPVGAVIVKDRQVLATGYNGSPSGSVHCTAQGYCYPGLISCDSSSSLPSRAVHAEANAIAQAAKHGISTQGASIYVTLEPCCHFGKTPPCTSLIISKGIKKVVVASKDPFEKVNGSGFKILQEAGVAVEYGILEAFGPKSVNKLGLFIASNLDVQHTGI